MNKFKQLLSLLLTLVMILSLPLVVYADDNAGGGGNGSAAVDDAAGASIYKQGFRMYVVDYDGNLKSKVIDLVTSNPTVDIAMKNTRIGNGFVNVPNDVYLMPADMPRPFIYSGAFIGNGVAVREWMRTKGADNQQNIVTLIEKYLGTDILDMFRDTSKEMYLCVEALSWHGIYTSYTASSYSGVSFYGTAYNWLQFYNQNGIADNTFTSVLDNNVLQRCMTLIRDQQNLNLIYPTDSGNINMQNLGNQGFGIQLYSNQEVFPACSTFDEPIGDTPHPAPDESKGSITIVKNYRTKNSDGTLIDDGCFVRENTTNTIKIEDEIQYKVVGWSISNVITEPDSVNYSIPGYISTSGKTPKTVTVKQPGKVLYVLLQKEQLAINENLETDYQIEESWITKPINLGVTEKGDAILSGKQFEWKYGSLECPGHGDGYCDCVLKPGETCTTDHTYYCTHKLDNTDWIFKLKNDKVADYNKIVAYNDFWTDYTNEVSEERDSLNSGNVNTEHEYKMVIHRGEDALSIAEWKNINEAIDSLDNFNTSNTESNRKKNDYISNISLNFIDDAPDKDTTSLGSENGCSDSDSAALSEEFAVDVSIKTKVYSGSATDGKLNTDINNSEMIKSGTGNTIISGRMVDSGLSFSFRPYIQMQYGTLDNTDKVFVLGQYNRSIKLNDYAEVEWKRSDTYNLKIDSTQWSTHAIPYTDLGDSQCLLPGGATLSLSIPKSARQTITVRTYQCILDGDGREQVEVTSGEKIDGYTKDTALQYHKGYVSSVLNGLQGLGVAQWQNKDYTADPFDGQQVFAEADIRDLGNGSSKASSASEKKYYFKLDQSGTSDSGLLDVKEGNTNTVYYTFSSDISGNILMNGEVILTKDQGVESLSGTAKMINSKTYVVTKLVDAIERNTGNDSTATWVNDGKWYNEAFDGIIVAISTTTIETGFIEPNERTTVLDPKLNTKSIGTKYMFRNEDNQPSYNVCAFKMQNFSSSYGKEYMIGEFKSNPVLMNRMDEFYYSKYFYTSNINVQDLH